MKQRPIKFRAWAVIDPMKEPIFKHKIPYFRFKWEVGGGKHFIDVREYDGVLAIVDTREHAEHLADKFGDEAFLNGERSIYYERFRVVPVDIQYFDRKSEKARAIEQAIERTKEEQ